MSNVLLEGNEILSSVDESDNQLNLGRELELKTFSDSGVVNFSHQSIPTLDYSIYF